MTVWNLLYDSIPKFKLLLLVSNDISSFKILLKFKLLLTLLKNCLFDDDSSVNTELKFKLLLTLLSNSLFNDIF